jgi:ribosomal protein S18 acetylase RimI-like enzyme
MYTLPAALLDRTGRPFVVRRFTAADRPALEAMYHAFEPKRGAQGLPPAGQGIRRWLDGVLADGEHLVVLVDGELLGHLMLLPMGSGRAELANFLHQEVRSRGIGTAINTIALQLAREAGHQRVWLCVEPTNLRAVRSYEKAGFCRLPGTLWSPEIEMEADLSAPARGSVPEREGEAVADSGPGPAPREGDP